MLKKGILLFYGCVFLLQLIFAQSIKIEPFQKVFIKDGEQKLIDIVQKDSFLIALGSSKFNDRLGVEILKLTYEGEEISSTRMSSGDYNINPFQMLISNSNELFFIAEHAYTNHNNSAIYKLNASLNVDTVCTFGTDSTFQTFNFIQQHGNSFYLTGTFSEPSMKFGNDFWVLKIDYNGSVIWDKHFGNDSINEVASSLQISNDKIFVFGDKNKPDFKYNPYYITLDTNGNFLKDTPLDWAYNCGVKMSCITNDNMYIVGESSSSTSSWFDIYVDKLDLNGNRIWRKLLPGTDKSETGFDVKFREDHLFITGYAHNTVLNNTDMHYTIIDTAGTIIEQKMYTYGGVDIGYQILPTDFGGFYIAGFGLNDTLQNYFLAYDTTSLLKNISGVTQKKDNQISFQVFPNPSSETFNLVFNDGFTGKVSVTNILGELILTRKIQNQTNINIDLEWQGMYYIVIENSENRAVRKIIKN